jgi:predicted ATPase
VIQSAITHLRRRSTASRDADAARFATQLADTLHELRITHKDLAEAIGVTRHAVDSWTRIASPALPAGDNLDRLTIWLEQRKSGAGKTLLGMLSERSARGAAAETLTKPGLHTPESRLIGRESELAAIRVLLDSARLLTLIGPGGIGKTRLAIQLASDCLPDYLDGAHVIELAPLSDPGLVAGTIATALGVQTQGAYPVEDTLAGWMTGRELLLVLDNCEHLLPVCRALAQTLLNASPGLTLLVTSREALGVPGELLRRVPPLDVPAKRDRQSVARAPAARLFTERALYTVRGFALNDENAPLVAEICRRLDGIPLAVELAASALSSMPLATLAERLEDRFKLLSSGRPEALPRQRTLRATIDWSYNLLSAQQQRLLQRVAVFRGGWTAEAADAILGDAPATGATTASQLIELARKSLINAGTEESQHGGPMRYAMLETIREYALEKLAANPTEARDAGERHARYFAALAQRAESELQGSAQIICLRRLDDELDNLRRAIAWGMTHAAPLALEVIGPLWFFWRTRNHLIEARRAAEEALAHVNGSAPLAKAHALLTAGVMAYYQGEHDTSGDYLRKARRIYETLSHRAGQALVDARIARIDMYHDRFAEAVALARRSHALAENEEEAWLSGYALLTLGEAYGRMGRDDDMAEAYQRGLDIMRAIGNPWGQAIGYNGIAGQALNAGRWPAAIESYEKSLAMHRDVGDLGEVSKVLSNLGECARATGDFARAETLYREALQMRLDMGALFGTRILRHNLAQALMAQGELDDAEDILRELLNSIASTEDGHSVGTYLVAVGTLWLKQERNLALAVRCYAAAIRAILAVSDGLDEPDRGIFESNRHALRERLGTGAFDAEWRAGSRMEIDAALAAACAALSVISP